MNSVCTFSSAVGSKHLWHPIVSTGAGFRLRIVRMLSSVCIQLGGCHFCCLDGDDDSSSWSVASDFNVFGLDRRLELVSLLWILTETTLSAFVLTSLESETGSSLAGGCFAVCPFLSTSSRRAGGFWWDFDAGGLGFSFSYSILIWFRLRLGEKYGDGMSLASAGSA